MAYKSRDAARKAARGHGSKTEIGLPPVPRTLDEYTRHKPNIAEGRRNESDAQARNIEAADVEEHRDCVGRGKCELHDWLAGMPPYGWSANGGAVDGHKTPRPQDKREVTEKRWK